MTNKRIPGKLKIAIQILGVLLAIILIAWMGVAAYVNTHKKELLGTITKLINDNISGTVIIESMDPALIKGFPAISLRLNKVRLRDSLWQTHQRDLLNANEVYVAVNAFSILTGRTRIQKISINKGSIYLYTDSTGYRNTNLFRRNKDAESNKINEIDLERIQVRFENKAKRKFFSFSVERLNSRLKYKSKSWTARTAVKMKINHLMFNTIKGSYAQNKIVNANLTSKYTHQDHVLHIPRQTISIGQDDLIISGNFPFAEDASGFTAQISSSAILLRNAASLLTPKARASIEKFKLEKPLAFNASISGRLKNKSIPLVQVRWHAKDNTLTFRGETINNCSFNGKYTNEVVPGKPRRDPNSAVHFYQMNGKWENIDFRADTIRVVNLKQPVLHGKFASRFPLARLNRISGGETFLFQNGTASLHLYYKAPFHRSDTGNRYINGTINIHNASFIYKPRNLPFQNVAANLNFKGSDLFLENIRVRSGGSSLQMEGSIRNFLNLYYRAPQNILIDWHIHSPHINLGEFLTFLGKRKAGKTMSARQGGAFSSMFSQLDQVLNKASAHMKLNVKRLTHRNFTANDISSDITLGESAILLKNISLSHGGGKLQLSGNVDQSGTTNRVMVNSRITNVDIRKLFYAFENFGQSGISYQNLKGNFFSDINVSGSLKDNGDVVPGSIYGTVAFELRNAALLNFEPMEKIGDFAFPRRNFSNITITHLKNTLDIKGDKIVIRPMLIRSSVLNVFVEGTYGISSGTDIALRVPLRNPEKDKDLSTAEKNERTARGLVLNLRAVEDENGKVKIKLGKGGNGEKK